MKSHLLLSRFQYSSDGEWRLYTFSQKGYQATVFRQVNLSARVRWPRFEREWSLQCFWSQHGGRVDTLKIHRRTESRRKKEGTKEGESKNKRDKTKGVFAEKNIKKSNPSLPLISVKNGQSEHFSSFEKNKSATARNWACLQNRLSSIWTPPSAPTPGLAPYCVAT